MKIIDSFLSVCAAFVFLLATESPRAVVITVLLALLVLLLLFGLWQIN